MLESIRAFVETLPPFEAEPIAYILMGLGGLFVLGAWANWRWLTEPRQFSRGDAVRRLIYVLWGDRGYRLYLFALGVAMVVLSCFMFGV